MGLEHGQVDYIRLSCLLLVIPILSARKNSFGLLSSLNKKPLNKKRLNKAIHRLPIPIDQAITIHSSPNHNTQKHLLTGKIPPANLNPTCSNKCGIPLHCLPQHSEANRSNIQSGPLNRQSNRHPRPHLLAPPPRSRASPNRHPRHRIIRHDRTRAPARLERTDCVS